MGQPSIVLNWNDKGMAGRVGAGSYPGVSVEPCAERNSVKRSSLRRGTSVQTWGCLRWFDHRGLTFVKQNTNSVLKGRQNERLAFVGCNRHRLPGGKLLPGEQDQGCGQRCCR